MPSDADQSLISAARTNAATYARYVETRSVPDAEQYVTAVRQLITLLPASADSNTESVRFAIAEYRKLLEMAESWLASARKRSTGGVRYLRTNCYVD